MTTRSQTLVVQGPRRVTRRGLRALSGALVAATSAALLPAPAHAEPVNTTVQAIRANAGWLAWAPPPENGPVAACLVDTGVDSNPDTSSSIVAASPLDADSAPGDGGTTKHGTLMASIMAAPHNSWGMVGAWPQLRIIDVRAVTPGADTFTYNNYQRAIGRCQFAKPATVDLAVINLSIGGDPSLVSAEERAVLVEAVDGAKEAGINVVASAGNLGGGVQAPGEYAGVFTVAAGDDGALCDFASHGPEVDLAAPGCGLDQAFPDGSQAVDGWGSSQAAAFTSAVVAALRAYKPSLTVAQAEAALLSTATPIAGGYKQLDVKAAFEAEGLAAIVAAAEAAMDEALAPPPAPSGGGGGGAPAGGGGSAPPPKEPEPAPTPVPAPAPTVPVAVPTPAPAPVPVAVDDVEEESLPTPKARKLRRHALGYRLTLTNRPRNALAVIRVYREPRARHRREFGHDRLVKRLRGEESRWLIDVTRWDRIEVVYRDGFAPDSDVLALTHADVRDKAKPRKAKRGERRRGDRSTARRSTKRRR